MATSIPLFQPGATPTCHADAAVTGARFVKVSGARDADLISVIHATAGDRTFGVSASDAAENGRVVVQATPGTITEVTAGEALTAGQEIESGAAGVAMIATTGVVAGIVVDDAANGAKALIKLV